MIRGCKSRKVHGRCKGQILFFANLDAAGEWNIHVAAWLQYLVHKQQIMFLNTQYSWTLNIHKKTIIINTQYS